MSHRRTNKKKRSFPFRRFSSMFLYLKSNSAREYVLLNHQRQGKKKKSNTDIKNADRE